MFIGAAGSATKLRVTAAKDGGDHRSSDYFWIVKKTAPTATTEAHSSTAASKANCRDQESPGSDATTGIKNRFEPDQKHAVEQTGLQVLICAQHCFFRVLDDNVHHVSW